MQKLGINLIAVLSSAFELMCLEKNEGVYVGRYLPRVNLQPLAKHSR